MAAMPGEQGGMMKSAWIEWTVAQVRALGPYLAVLILPGGSLLALLLWLYRRRLALQRREGALR